MEYNLYYDKDNKFIEKLDPNQFVHTRAIKCLGFNNEGLPYSLYSKASGS